MSTFTELPYTRPDLAALQASASEIFDRFAASETFADQWQATLDYVDARRVFTSASELAMVRHTIDTTDEFYSSEQDFYDENSPKVSELNDKFYTLLLDSQFRAEFSEKLGGHFFNVIALQKKVFSPEIMDDLAAENALITTYDKLLGGAQVAFRGESYTLAGLGKFNEDADRATRHEAQTAAWGFFADNAAELDRIYDELVALRHGMARTLGYDNFVQMGYDRMTRPGYGPSDVANFRAGVQQFVTPRASQVFAKQRERLGLDELRYYDVPFKFVTGNPKPQGDESWMKQRAKTMYDEMAPETSELFNRLLDAGLMDLSQKKGKQPGGYCTFLDVADMPFIFSNFNGTSGDVDVLTHEFGHSFQFYRVRERLLDEQKFAGAEAAEVHSMSMEYLAYPWMGLFFGDDVDKYHYAHQTGTITFLPYGALVDHFQEWVYSNPEATPAERKAQWLVLEGQYMPWVDYADNEFLASGGRWQRQGHLFWSAFYYIDYCLAQFSAMQVFLRAQDDPKAAWRDYVAMCDAAGSVDFVDMLAAGNIGSPFDAAVVGRTLEGIAADIASIDTASF